MGFRFVSVPTGTRRACSSFLPRVSAPASNYSPVRLPTLAGREQRIILCGENKEYLTIEGLDAFRKATVELLLGAGHPAIKEVRAPGAASRLCRPGPAARLRAPAAGG